MRHAIKEGDRGRCPLCDFTFSTVMDAPSLPRHWLSADGQLIRVGPPLEPQVMLGWCFRCQRIDHVVRLSRFFWRCTECSALIPGELPSRRPPRRPPCPDE